MHDRGPAALDTRKSVAHQQQRHAAPSTGHASQTPMSEHGHLAAQWSGQFHGLRSLSENAGSTL